MDKRIYQKTSLGFKIGTRVYFDQHMPSGINLEDRNYFDIKMYNYPPFINNYKEHEVWKIVNKAFDKTHYEYWQDCIKRKAWFVKADSPRTEIESINYHLISEKGCHLVAREVFSKAEIKKFSETRQQILLEEKRRVLSLIYKRGTDFRKNIPHEETLIKLTTNELCGVLDKSFMCPVTYTFIKAEHSSDKKPIFVSTSVLYSSKHCVENPIPKEQVLNFEKTGKL